MSEKIFQLEKFNEAVLKGKKTSQIIIEKLEKIDNLQDIQEFTDKANEPNYVYWTKLKHWPLPKGMASHEEFWVVVKFFRKTQSKKTIIKDESGEYYRWIKLQNLEKFLHEIDLNTGGNLFISEERIDDKDKHKFIARGTMEEAIASSQLEGANTTRKVAKQFLREGRKPKNKAEQMILNNYLAIQTIEEDYKGRELTLDTLLELHSILTKDTVPKNKRGQFRTNKDNIIVGDSNGAVYHVPPKMEFVRKEIDRLIAYANDELNDSTFVHPIIKAIFIHFWIGYLHPFFDGNGRLARALFYWYLLKKGYWAFAYLPISKIIKKSPGQYRDAYLYSEQDDYDLTYFLDYNLRKIKQAIKDFQEYVEEKSKDNRIMNKLSKVKYGLNDRQIKLLQYYYGNRDERTSLKIHMNIYQISKVTAFKDLKMLVKLGFVIPKKEGRNVYYYATDKVDRLLHL